MSKAVPIKRKDTRQAKSTDILHRHLLKGSEDSFGRERLMLDPNKCIGHQKLDWDSKKKEVFLAE